MLWPYYHKQFETKKYLFADFVSQLWPDCFIWAHKTVFLQERVTLNMSQKQFQEFWKYLFLIKIMLHMKTSKPAKIL